MVFTGSCFWTLCFSGGDSWKISLSVALFALAQERYLDSEKRE